jgi:hypothetical protein
MGPTLLRGVVKEQQDGDEGSPGEGAAFVRLSSQPYSDRPAHAQVLSWPQSTVRQKQTAEATRIMAPDSV